MSKEKSEFQLFIITRFNLLIDEPGWQRDVHGEKVLSPAWMKSRFSLFKDHCFPSVLNQSDSSFIWLVYFSHDTADVFKKEINHLRKKYAFFKPIYVQDHVQFFKQLNHDILKEISPNTQEIISLRLDNDDMLRKDYVSEVKRIFVEHRDAKIINFQKGYCLQLKPNIKISHHANMRSPFLAKIDSVPIDASYRSIIQFDHTTIQDQFNIHQYREKAMWIQLIHERNLDNRFKGKPTISLQDSEDFGLLANDVTSSIYTWFKSTVKFYLFAFWIQKIGLIKMNKK